MSVLAVNVLKRGKSTGHGTALSQHLKPASINLSTEELPSTTSLKGGA